MSSLSIIVLSLGLAIDCFAVSIASAVAIKKVKFKHALKIALFFGFFQSLMAALGWFTGFQMKEIIQSVDHWIAFCLLSFIGAKMIYESSKIEEAEEKNNPLKLSTLLILSVATSIDALAVGIPLSVMSISMTFTITSIGLASFFLSLFGIAIGTKTGHWLENKVEWAGGVVLILIGFKILLEHLNIYSF